MAKVIDIHTFIGEWPGTDASSTTESLLASMKDAGIDQAVTMTTSEDQNESVRKIVESKPGKLYFSMWFVPDEGHLAYLDRYRDQIRMVKVHSSNIKTRLDDPKMIPLLKLCERDTIPMLVHCGRWLEMAGYNIALRVAERYETNILLAHMGGVIPSLAKEAVDSIRDRNIKNVYLVTSGMAPSQDTYWLGRCPPDLIRYAVDALGGGRIMLGSDYPFGKQDEMAESIKNANLNEDDRMKILSTNAQRTLRLK